MRALSNPATFFGHAFMIASKRLAHPNFAGRHLHILWLWDHNCVPKNVMVYHPKKTLPKSEVVSTPSCAWCPKPRLPEWIMTCEKGNEHLVLEEIDLRGGKGSPWVSSSEHVYFTVHSCGSFLKRSPPQYVLSGCGGSPNWLWWQHFVRPRGTDLSFLVNTHLFGHKLIIDLIHHLSKVLVACGMWHRVCESWENMVT